MTERGLAAIVEGCPWLENLSLAGTCNFIFTPECFPILAFKARNLRFLNVLGPHFDAKTDQMIRDIVFPARLESKVDDGDTRLFQYRLLPLK
jgi:hypothetical protein